MGIPVKDTTIFIESRQDLWRRQLRHHLAHIIIE
jgi:hypothetical protein